MARLHPLPLLLHRSLDANLPISSLNVLPMSTNPPEPTEIETLMPEAFVHRHRQVRNLILDYSLANAIVGLNPIPSTLWLTLLITIGLLLKMGWDIGKLWGFPKGQDVLAFVGQLFGIIGAFAIALLAWLTVTLLGLLVPALRALSLSAFLCALTWSLGQAIHHFYFSGHPKLKSN